MNRKYAYLFLLFSSIVQLRALNRIDSFEVSVSIFGILFFLQVFIFFYFTKDLIKKGFLTRFLTAIFLYVLPVAGVCIFLKHAMSKKINIKKDLINGILLNLMLVAAVNISAPNKVLYHFQSNLLNFQSSYYLGVPQSSDNIVEFFKSDKLKKCKLDHECEIIELKKFIENKNIYSETLPTLMSFHFLYRFDQLQKQKVKKEAAYNSLLITLSFYKDFLASNKALPHLSSLPLANPFLSLELSIITINRLILMSEIQKKIEQKIDSFTQGVKSQIKN